MEFILEMWGWFTMGKIKYSLSSCVVQKQRSTDPGHWGLKDSSRPLPARAVGPDCFRHSPERHMGAESSSSLSFFPSAFSPPISIHFAKCSLNDHCVSLFRCVFHQCKAEYRITFTSLGNSDMSDSERSDIWPLCEVFSLEYFICQM